MGLGPNEDGLSATWPWREACWAGSTPLSELGENGRAERVDKGMLIAPDLMQLQLFKTEFDEFVEPSRVLARVR